MTKTAIILYSDPKSGSEEALGRLFNGLFLAYELKEKKQDVAGIFQGAVNGELGEISHGFVLELSEWGHAGPDHVDFPAVLFHGSASDRVRAAGSPIY